MAWIAVHEEVLGSKLRGFRKRIGCSEAEALGILTMLWLWARKNADSNGLLPNTDKDDIADALRHSISNDLDANAVTEAMLKCGFIDHSKGQYYIHDWYEWQQFWYRHLERMEKDRARKRLERERQTEARSEEQAVQHDSSDRNDPPPDVKADKERDAKPQRIKKVKYAEDVSMQETEYGKLVEQYGEPFTQKLIEELNNYKLANGKRYKDDYRAILNWVVERCEKKYPDLRKRPSQSTAANGNPFA